PIDCPEFESLGTVSEGLCRIRDALARHSGERNLAVQAQGGIGDLLAEYVDAAPTIYASEFYGLDVFGEMLERMGSEPEELARTYNDAVGSNPDAGVSTLIANEVNDRWELPLWRIGPSEPRRRVYSEQLDELDRASVVPRALSMTAVARAYLCDLFIHGTGGGQYDRLTEQWMLEWMGMELSGAVVASATLTLPLRDEHPTPEQVKDAVDLAHRAQHNPELLGDEDRAAAKEALLASIAEQKSRDADPSDLFHSLQALLREYRDEHKDELDGLRRHAALLRKRLGERPIVEDRTWAFPLFAHERLSELDACIAHQFEIPGVGV
ncbi:MAG: hypothetical protein ACYTF7_09835, partial [Planctomycetota bacterium]